jgi:hypothetical protein
MLCMAIEIPFERIERADCSPRRLPTQFPIQAYDRNGVKHFSAVLFTLRWALNLLARFECVHAHNRLTNALYFQRSEQARAECRRTN